METNIGKCDVVWKEIITLNKSEQGQWKSISYPDGIGLIEA
jgi:hypothetical protein